MDVIRPSAAIEEERLAPYISEVDDVAAYIAAIDFSLMKENMLDDPNVGWTEAKLDFIERQYRNWMLLRRLNADDMGAVPPVEPDLDVFWHFHILDTYAYTRDCSAVFGRYHHHFPYFGIRDEADLEDLIRAAEGARQKYFDRFGEKLESYEDYLERHGKAT